MYIYKTVSNNHASTQSDNDDKLQEGTWTIFCEDPNKYIGKGYNNFEKCLRPGISMYMKENS